MANYLQPTLNSHPTRPKDLPTNYRLKNHSFVPSGSVHSISRGIVQDIGTLEESQAGCYTVTAAWEDNQTLRLSFSPNAPIDFHLSGTCDDWIFNLHLDRNDDNIRETIWTNDFKSPSSHCTSVECESWNKSCPDSAATFLPAESYPVRFTDSDPEEIAREIGNRPNAPFESSRYKKHQYSKSTETDISHLPIYEPEKNRNKDKIHRALSFEQGDEIGFTVHPDRLGLVRNSHSTAFSSISTESTEILEANKIKNKDGLVTTIVSQLESLDHRVRRYFTDPTPLTNSTSIPGRPRCLTAVSEFSSSLPKIFLSPPKEKDETVLSSRLSYRTHDRSPYQASSGLWHHVAALPSSQALNQHPVCLVPGPKGGLEKRLSKLVRHPSILGPGPLGTQGTLAKFSKCLFDPDSKAKQDQVNYVKFHRLYDSPNLRVDRTKEDCKLLGPGSWHSDPSPRAHLPPVSIRNQSKRPLIRPVERVQGYPLSYPTNSMGSWCLYYNNLDLDEFETRPRYRSSRRKVTSDSNDYVESTNSDDLSIQSETSRCIIHLGSHGNVSTDSFASKPDTPFRHVLAIARSKLKSSFNPELKPGSSDPKRIECEVYKDALSLARSHNLQRKFRTAQIQTKARGLLHKVRNLLNPIRRTKSPLDKSSGQRNRLSAAAQHANGSLDTQFSGGSLDSDSSSLPERANSLRDRLKHAIGRKDNAPMTLYETFSASQQADFTILEPDVLYYCDRDSIQFQDVEIPITKRRRWFFGKRRKYSPLVSYRNASGDWVQTKAHKASMYRNFAAMLFWRQKKRWTARTVGSRHDSKYDLTYYSRHDSTHSLMYDR